MRYGVMMCLLLAGCNMSDDSRSKTTVPDTSGCGADAYADLVGEPVANHSFPEEARILPPGSVMTMDHRPDRLNVDVNQDGDIARLWCG